MMMRSAECDLGRALFCGVGMWNDGAGIRIALAAVEYQLEAKRYC